MKKNIERQELRKEQEPFLSHPKWKEGGWVNGLMSR